MFSEHAQTLGNPDTQPANEIDHHVRHRNKSTISLSEYEQIMHEQ
jgi:hypothetical protein